MYRVLLFILLSSITTFAQDVDKTRTSPVDIASLRYKDSYIKITYSQPQKRGRDIFGELIPFGKVWQLGANEATEITITRDITVNGILLKSGTYSLFAIPNETKWTMIVNSELGLWGSYNYNSKLDVFRFEIPVLQVNDGCESLTMKLKMKNDLAELLICWDKTSVSIPIKFLTY